MRTIDLSRPLHALTDVVDYTVVRVLVTWNSRTLGSVDIANYCQPVGVARLREAIVDSLSFKLLEPDRDLSADSLQTSILAAMTRHYMPAEDMTTATTPAKLPADVSVSIMAATHNQSNDLHNHL
jgi:hypothetical protein